MQPFWIALQFLTRIPVRLPGMPAPEQIGRSLLWYPAVGLLMGALLLVVQWLLGAQPPLLQAALLLALWVALSGALHLDGLADTVDAWIGGYGDRERTLELMKDPRCGPMAVVALVLLLLLKFAALLVLLQAGQVLALLLAPWLARLLLPLLFQSTAYVRPGGLGSLLAEQLPRERLPHVAGLHALLILACGWHGLLALLVAAGVLIGWRRVLLARLGGTTGDTAGALVELCELAVLLALALLAS